MFARLKTVKAHGKTYTYLQVVENTRVQGRVRQRVLANLGRVEDLQEGKVDAFIQALTRFTQGRWLTLQQAAEALGARWSKAWGPALIAERLWREAGLDRALRRVLADRQIAFDLPEAVFAMVLNGLMDPCSKLGLMAWKETVYRPGFEGLQLQHLYRSLDVLAEHKEAIEDGLFARMRDLFWLKVDLVFCGALCQGPSPAALAA